MIVIGNVMSLGSDFVSSTAKETTPAPSIAFEVAKVKVTWEGASSSMIVKVVADGAPSAPSLGVARVTIALSLLSSMASSVKVTEIVAERLPAGIVSGLASIVKSAPRSALPPRVNGTSIATAAAASRSTVRSIVPASSSTLCAVPAKRTTGAGSLSRMVTEVVMPPPSVAFTGLAKVRINDSGRS